MNMVNVSWGDHRTYGKNKDSRLLTLDAIERRMAVWKEKLNADKILWRGIRKAENKLFNSFYNIIRKKVKAAPIDWEDHEVPAIAHRLGMKIYLYVHLFDEGWPLPSLKMQKVSYHTANTAQHSTRMSRFSYEHPEYQRIDRSGTKRQWGVLSLSYPEVRKYFREYFLESIDDTDFDGLFVCLRSQSKPAEFADQFGFNEPIRTEYYKRYGEDILSGDFDLWRWRRLEGEYLTIFIEELREELDKRNVRLSIGVPTGHVIGPPVGNMVIDWRTWVIEGLVDELIINQNATYCPSYLNRLWPMHTGFGYVQDYIDGYNIPELSDYIRKVYSPIFNKLPAQLYVSTQWDSVQPHKGRELKISDDYGLVYGSFEFENPGYKMKG